MSYLIHGHVHGTIDSEVYDHIKKYHPHALIAGVDINGYEPVTYEELKTKIFVATGAIRRSYE